jgi:hypothetical protein
MALCPNVPPPAIDPDGAVDSLVELDHGIVVNQKTVGDELTHPGDYTIAGVGTRKSGTGVIRLFNIPPGTQVIKSFLIYNTYQSNNQADPDVKLNGVGGVANLYGRCGSTCWFNPPFEATTYLSNRVYIKDVSAIVTGNGSYTVTGMPFTPAMRIGTDGDRIPGCQCNQGAILYVIWKWLDGKGPAITPALVSKRFRGIRAYIGAKLLSSIVAFGGTPTYNLPFIPVFDEDMSDPPVNTYYKGNTHIEVAAGDTQNSIPGDSFAINQVRFATPNNAFTKIGSSLCVRKFSVAQIYDGENSAFARTTNDCICWFFFVISGDKTQPKSQFEIVTCAATILVREAAPEDTQIVVNSNFVDNSQTVAGGPCRAVPYIDTGLPPTPNAPGMFPKGTYYIKIGKEIMRVIGKGTQYLDPSNKLFPMDQTPTPMTPTHIDDPKPIDEIVWTVERGQAGTAPTFHPTSVPDGCVYMLAPPRFIRDMQAGLTPRGPGNQRQNAGRPAAEQERR